MHIIFEQDMTLMQNFILEQFSLLKRVVLSYKFFKFDDVFPGTCDPILWILSWGYVWAIFALGLYWMLMWGVKGNRILDTVITSWHDVTLHLVLC